jgi:hypothetical protein
MNDWLKSFHILVNMWLSILKVIAILVGVKSHLMVVLFAFL